MNELEIDQFKRVKQLKWFEMQHRGCCTICGKKFRNNDLSFLGFLEGNEPAHMCNGCKIRAIEVFNVGTFKNKDVSLPLPGAKLWRYMDFTKFMHLLETRSLYFSRVDQFDDPFEGAYGIKMNEKVWIEREETWRKSWLRERCKELKLSEEDIEKLSKLTFEKFRSRANRWRNINFVNCWHMSECESEAMWKIYSGNHKNSIAIQTTFEHLYNALPLDFIGDFGAIKYINYKEYNAGIDGKSIHPFNALWYKREAFAYEREFRVKIEDMSSAFSPKLGMSVRVNLQKLMQGIYVSPLADGYFYDLVRGVLKRYGLRVNVWKSEMLEEPLL